MEARVKVVAVCALLAFGAAGVGSEELAGSPGRLLQDPQVACTSQADCDAAGLGVCWRCPGPGSTCKPRRTGDACGDCGQCESGICKIDSNAHSFLCCTGGGTSNASYVTGPCGDCGVCVEGVCDLTGDAVYSCCDGHYTSKYTCKKTGTPCGTCGLCVGNGRLRGVCAVNEFVDSRLCCPANTTYGSGARNFQAGPCGNCGTCNGLDGVCRRNSGTAAQCCDEIREPSLPPSGRVVQRFVFNTKQCTLDTGGSGTCQQGVCKPPHEEEEKEEQVGGCSSFGDCERCEFGSFRRCRGGECECVPFSLLGRGDGF